MKVLPVICPACSNQVKVKTLICDNCDTQIEGFYELPVLAQLSVDDQLFILDFVKVSGSLKEMAKLMKLSYPTVRNRLDEVIERITLAEEPNSAKIKETT